VKTVSIRCPSCNVLIQRDNYKEVIETQYGVFDLIVYCGMCHKDQVLHFDFKTKPTIDGYVLIRVVRLIFRDNLRPLFYQSMIPEHRYTWERNHGHLPEGYVIHHINGIKSDNRLENLIAMPKSSHNSYLQGRDYARHQIECPICHFKFLM
jgi:hypothetical protein